MKYLMSLLIGITFYHLVVCSIGSFVMWELTYLTFSEWMEGTRFFYIAGLLFICLIVTVAHHEGNQQ